MVATDPTATRSANPLIELRQDRPPRFFGGAPEDQARILARYHDQLAANDALDNDALRKLWTDDPENVFFNFNQYTYYGREDWLKVWDYYRSRFKPFRPYTTGDVDITISGDMALLTADQVGRYKEWIGQEPGDSPRHYRATMVFVRKPGDDWQAIHVHFSLATDGPRPEQVFDPPLPPFLPEESARADRATVGERAAEQYSRKQDDGVMGAFPIMTLDEAGSQRGFWAKGGSEADQRAVLRLHHEFLTANDAIDPPHLRDIWSHDPDCYFFNTNRHTYYGLEDWLKVWDLYGPRYRRVRPYTTGNIRIWISGDMALTTGDYGGRNKEWISADAMSSSNPKFYRLTTVATKQGGTWKTIHAHFSDQSLGPRPDQQA
jgi:ketosteroid isomerase-like protein